MLLPRFSTRVILLVTAVCAIYFLTVGLAIRGSIWAAGVAVAATSLALVALVHAALFGLCYVVARAFTQRKSSPSRAPLWLVALSLLALPGSLAAGTGTVITIPDARVKPKSGLRITVDSTWVENYGYRPIHVTVTSLKPATADQTITFRFSASHWRFGQQPLIEVDQDIELAEGATTASATVLVPKLQDWQLVGWDVLVDGEFEKELSVDRTTSATSGWFNQVGGGLGDNVPRVLIVVNEGQQASMPASIVSANNYGMYGYGGDTLVTIQNGQPVTAPTPITMSISGTHFAAERTIAALPTQWLAYTSLDQLVLTPDHLVRIQSENPEAWTAISHWVRSGGNLWLCDLGDEWDELPDVLEGLGPLVERDEQGDVLWYAPFANNVSVSSVFLREATAQPRSGQPPSGGAAFAWRPAATGAVLISQKPFDQLNGQEWNWLQDGEGQQLGWISRHGTGPNLPNESFANLLIPGVGLAPVTEFRILITLFVLLIGPVNYWFLRRYKRLHLLILSVPLAALVVTLALFAYAIVGDGLDTRLRVRSFTALDQEHGEAVSWARLSYYAGLAPSGGLEFPADTAVYPINPGWSEMSNFGGDVPLTPRAIQWADKQYLTEGWLASRTPTQYLSIAARPSDRRLEIATQDDGLRVTNQLGAAIELLLLRDQDGRLFLGDSLAPDASAALTLVKDESPLAGRLRGLFQDNEPIFPEGFDEQHRGIASRPYQYRSSYATYGYGGPASTSRLEQRIKSFTQPVGAGSDRSINLPSGTYLAITRRGVEVATGLPDQDEEDSFHVVHGTW